MLRSMCSIKILACITSMTRAAGEERRPIIEFAVENAQTLKKRTERSDRAQQDRDAASNGVHPAQGGQDEQQALAEQKNPARAASAGADGAGPRTASAPKKRKRADGSEVCTAGMLFGAYITWIYNCLLICCSRAAIKDATCRAQPIPCRLGARASPGGGRC